MRITIIGAGLSGTWLTHAAQRAGHTVTLVSDGKPSADNAALAMLRPSYFPPEERHLLKESLAYWDVVGEVHSGAMVNRHDRAEYRYQKDWFTINPKLPPVDPDYLVMGTAEPVSSTSVRVGPLEIDSDVVVWCTATGEDGKDSYGVTWVNDDPDALETPDMRVHHYAPYKTLVAVRYSDHCRLGTSSANTLVKAETQAEKFFDRAIELGWVEGKGDWYPVSGRRFQRSTYLTRDDSGWFWGGFHRSGFGIVPALADGVIESVTA